ncbi:triose-phosphate isomerase [Candidatus Dependentiae bacterium]|nr:triose-phosphate isomerase [Candidatus Dependentiae bacterium]
MNKRYLFVNNWKMNLSFNETIEFATNNYDRLVELATKTEQKIILCPSTESIYPLAQIFKETPISIGAQTVSRHTHGAFTGQVAPQSLQEIGCTHCIIGHSETKKEFTENDKCIAQKCVHLLDYDITPIICIGETEQENKSEKTLGVLESQLAPLLNALNTKTTVRPYLEPCIAYEPIWSIGTGNTPNIAHLDTIFTWLTEHIGKHAPNISWKLLYGGSINPESISLIKKISKIDGFLVGGAGLDFQKIEKIVK